MVDTPSLTLCLCQSTVAVCRLPGREYLPLPIGAPFTSSLPACARHFARLMLNALQNLFNEYGHLRGVQHELFATLPRGKMRTEFHVNNDGARVATNSATIATSSICCCLSSCGSKGIGVARRSIGPDLAVSTV